MVKGRLISELQKLASLQKDSSNVYTVAQDLILLVFREPKPLFPEVAERTKAASLVKTSLPLFETSFATLHGSLNPDLRQIAQRCRSGLQFLIDEFEENREVYEELKPILTSSPVKCVEEYIEHTRDIPPEYSHFIPEVLTGIPASHFWWFGDTESQEEALLKVKICFALFGPPTEDAEDIESAYSDEQRKTAGEIMKVILKVFDDSPAKQLRVGFIFISCKQDEKQFVLPLFSIFVGVDGNGLDLRQFVDTQCRVYKNWDDWKSNNCLPMLKYAYPQRGYFTCSGNADYVFDEEREPDVEYGTSPQCDVSSRIFRQADNVSTIASLGAGIVGVVACFTPLAPIVLTGAVIAGTTSAGYGAARGIGRLVDKGQHGESLTDLESFVLWLSIAAMPLHVISSAVNGTLVMGAQQGRIFSSSMRMFATVLNFTTLGLDSVMLVCGLANLIHKAINKQLTGLDILQLSMSVFFFTNTLMQPKVAGKIIRMAQEQHFDRHMNAMTDPEARAAFKNFLDQNLADGTITERSKIVRTINRMQDPNTFFKGTGDAKVTIGGRKGKTVLVTDAHGDTARVNPNSVYVNRITGQPNSSAYDFRKDFKRLQKCYGRDPNDVELNGEKIFQNMTDMQKRRIGRAYGASARKFDQNIIQTSHTVAEAMGFNTVDQLMSVIEIVSSEVQGKSGNDLTAALNHISGAGRDQFIDGIQCDVTKAIECAQANHLSFNDPLTAVYHYRKHGAEFPKAMMKFGNGIDVYLGPVSDGIFNDSNLREICTLQDGTVRRIYASGGDKFGVVTSTPEGSKISTIFHKPGCNHEYIERIADLLRNAPGLMEPVIDVANHLAKFMGFGSIPIRIFFTNEESTSVDCNTKIDPVVHEHIAHLLNAIENTE